MNDMTRMIRPQILMLLLVIADVVLAQDSAPADPLPSGRAIGLYGPTSDDWEAVKAPSEVAFLQVYDFSIISPSKAPPLDDDTLKMRLIEFINLRAIIVFAPHATDGFLTSINELEKLEVIMIAKSKVTDDGILKLSNSPKLRILALWETNVSQDGIRRLRSMNDRIDIEVTSDDIGGRYVNRSGYPTSELVKEIRRNAGDEFIRLNDK